MAFKSNIFLVLIGLIIFSIDAHAHEFYVSVCHIKKSNESLSIQIRIFKNDLEKAIKRKKGIGEIYIIDDVRDNIYQTDIQLYINDHFHVSVNEQRQSLELISITSEGEGELETIISEWSVPSTSMNDRISVQSEILLNIYDDQINMIHFKNGKTKKSKSLNKRVKKCIF